jgi:hypothetical protein
VRFGPKAFFSFASDNSKDEVKCSGWNASKSIVYRNAGLESEQPQEQQKTH